MPPAESELRPCMPEGSPAAAGDRSFDVHGHRLASLFRPAFLPFTWLRKVKGAPLLMFYKYARASFGLAITFIERTV
ncbi:hypothetical protein JANAI62_10300 [Jannaschia pagri]|uniref:Uncharacterized protein n=1 Tax=Jannaschia pagri TaxID=2829797 RepID=A0ABQ4NJZ5_9RHOB|nr:hypothetical protein JANAI61_10330 [Jannaschia sp. AI_61]GIT94407.1 hypothetical protein JANAI62_10300 [Jannaschia sp. AI_62]